MTRSMLVLTVGILTLASSSHAQQDTARLVPGERVRVKLEKGGHVVGTFLSADATTMRVLTAPPDTASMDRAAVAAVEVSVGTKSRALSGALIGATVGALAAASITYLAEGSPGTNESTLVVGAAVGASSWVAASAP